MLALGVSVACSNTPAPGAQAPPAPGSGANQPIASHASGVASGGDPAAAMASAPAAAAVVQVTEPVAPAPGGITIAALWAKSKTLAGKTVTVRGKVVKFNGEILGLDWTHIQDGSGVAKDGTHDITITSKPPSAARVGDVVTVTGTVVLGKDFGAGYAYAVMIQNATIIVK